MSLLRNTKTQRNLLPLMTPFLIDLEHCVDRSCTLLNLATNNSSQLTGQTIIQQVIPSVQISNLRFRPHSPVFLRFVLSKIVQWLWRGVKQFFLSGMTAFTILPLWFSGLLYEEWNWKILWPSLNLMKWLSRKILALVGGECYPIHRTPQF